MQIKSKEQIISKHIEASKSSRDENAEYHARCLQRLQEMGGQNLELFAFITNLTENIMSVLDYFRKNASHLGNLTEYYENTVGAGTEAPNFLKAEILKFHDDAVSALLHLGGAVVYGILCPLCDKENCHGKDKIMNKEPDDDDKIASIMSLLEKLIGG